MTTPTKNGVPPISDHSQQKQTSRSTDQERDLSYVSGDARPVGSAESLSKSELESKLEAEPGPETEPDRIDVDHRVDSDGYNDDEINNDVTSPKFPEVEEEPVPTEQIPHLPPE